jgi:chromosome segregation ATPase
VLDELAAAIIRCDEKTDQARSFLAELHEEVSQLSEKQRELYVKQLLCVEECDSMDGQISETLRQIEQLDNAIETEKSDFKPKPEALSARSRKISLQTGLINISAKFSDSKKTVSNLRQRVEGLSVQSANLHESRDAIAREIASADSFLTKFIPMRSILENGLFAKRSVFLNLSRQSSSINLEQIQGLEDEMAEQHLDVEAVYVRTKALSQKINSFKARSNNIFLKNGELTLELHRLRGIGQLHQREFAEMRDTLVDQTERERLLLSEIKEIEEEISRAESCTERRQALLMKRMEEVDSGDPRVEWRIDRTRGEVEKLENDIKMMEARVIALRKRSQRKQESTK